MTPMDSVKTLEKHLGYHFSDKKLLLEAIAHKSFVHEKNEEIYDHYERMEFLGDSILGFIISDILYRQYPDYSEGKLSMHKSKLISGEMLAHLARNINLGEHVLIGKGEEKSGGRGRKSLLAETLESVIGAIYLDGGLEPTRKFIENLYYDLLKEDLEGVRSHSYKTELQEYIQSLHKCKPEYTVVSEEGPDHEKIFHVSAYVLDNLLGTGWGKSKKEAETMAAKQAFQALISGRIKLPQKVE